MISMPSLWRGPPGAAGISRSPRRSLSRPLQRGPRSLQVHHLLLPVCCPACCRSASGCPACHRSTSVMPFEWPAAARSIRWHRTTSSQCLLPVRPPSSLCPGAAEPAAEQPAKPALRASRRGRSAQQQVSEELEEAMAPAEEAVPAGAAVLHSAAISQCWLLHPALVSYASQLFLAGWVPGVHILFLPYLNCMHSLPVAEPAQAAAEESAKPAPRGRRGRKPQPPAAKEAAEAAPADEHVAAAPAGAECTVRCHCMLGLALCFALPAWCRPPTPTF